LTKRHNFAPTTYQSESKTINKPLKREVKDEKD
jgi:hypothetical protein